MSEQDGARERRSAEQSWKIRVGGLVTHPFPSQQVAYALGYQDGYVDLAETLLPASAPSAPTASSDIHPRGSAPCACGHLGSAHLWLPVGDPCDRPGCGCDGWEDAGLTPDQPVTLAGIGIARQGVLVEIAAQVLRYGDEAEMAHLPNGTGPGVSWMLTGRPTSASHQAEVAQFVTDEAESDGSLTHMHLLREKVSKAFAQNDPEALRAALVRVAATSVQWIESLDRETEEQA